VQGSLLLRRASWALLLLLVPAVAPAQEEGAVPEVVPRSPGILFETVRYHDVGLRDPFIPLNHDRFDSGPRFEELTLTGVFLGTPGNSLVVLEDRSRRGHFLRIGESIGGAHLIEILPDAAVFEIREYGAARREILRLERHERPEGGEE